MKKRMLAVFLALLMLSGCGGPKNLAPKQAAASGEIPESDAAALADFSLALLRENWGGNVLLSPLSALCALGMTANGANGETLAQMEDVLGLPVASLNADLAAWSGSLTEDAQIVLANSLWVRDGGTFQPEDAFLDAAGRTYGAEVIPAKLDASSAGQINQWVKKHTGGMVDRIVDEIPPNAMLYLINALALDAEWEDVYKSYQVQENIFTTEDGEEQPATLMYSLEGWYIEDGQAQGFLKPYKGDRWAFAALLPEEGLSLEAYASTLTGEHLRELLNAEDALVEAGIPKFESASAADLAGSLKALGMPDAFSAGAADFSGMGTCDAGPLYISKVLHHTSISVTERGTKAGAATAAEVECGAAPDFHTVFLNRPFLYMLVDRETNLPAFIGAVTSLK